MNLDTVVMGLSFKPVDIVFIGLFIALIVAIAAYVIFNKVKANKTAKAIQEEFERLELIDEGKLEATETPELATTGVEDVKKNEILEPEEKAEPEKEANTTSLEEKEPKVLEENKDVAVDSEETPKLEEESLDDTKKESEEATEETLEENKENNEKAKRQYNGKYEIYKENEYYRYRLKASNGEVLFISEIYASRDGALKSIGAVWRNLEKGKIEIFADKRKNYKFQLKAANHRVLAISASYSTSQGAQNASESFKRFAQTQDIVDVELPAEELADTSLVEIPKVKEEDKKGGKFLLKKDSHGVFSWELKASNGEILCQADGYSSKSSLETSIDSFKVSVKNGKFYIYADKSDYYQFKLYSQSGRVAMVGESYSTSQQAQSVVTSILNFLDLATIVDKTVAPVKKTAKPTTKK